jgi:hypothetical protein
MNQEINPQFESERALAAEVEQLELWFAKVSKRYPTPACRVIEQVKIRTSVAVGEHALADAAEGLSPFELTKVAPPSIKTVAATKDAVRQELAKLKAAGGDKRAPASKSRAPWWGAMMTLASAAMIALVVLPGYLKSTEPKEVAEVSALDDWAYVLTEATSTEFDNDVAGFKADMNELDDALVYSEDLPDELGIDDIEDAIDQLYSDSASFLES